MRYSFRLAELLGHMPDPRKRPGTIKAIVEHTGLDRHQVAALLKNEVKYIPLMALSRLCDYLIENGHVSADQLPGALFAVEPEHFWEMLARRRRLELCMGVRRPEGQDSLDGAWVVASDSVLLGELLNGVSTLGGTAKHIAGATAQSGPPHPEHIKQSLIWSPGQDTDERIVAQARETYEEFVGTQGDRALVCLGSTKSNPVGEIILSTALGAEPFVTQDDVAKPTDRKSPFFLRYRNDDPHPPSCSAGLKLCKSSGDSLKPGIYYETAKGDWDVCEWERGTQDAAFVFYVHRESQGRLEMSLGGFSGRATRLLAKLLVSRGEELWPPCYEANGVQIGAFVIKFTFSASDQRGRDAVRDELPSASQVVRLDASVIERRMEMLTDPAARRIPTENENGNGTS